MATNSPYPPSPGAPAAGRKKAGPIVWILGIIAAMVIFAMLAIFGIGLFVVHKVKQAGNNPGFAIARMVTAMNPDIEVISTDEGQGTITIREKKTGKTMMMNFEDAKKGKFTFTSDGKEATITTMQGADGKSAMEINSSDGSLKIGASGNLPSWIPTYPASHPQANFSAQGKDGESGSFQFESKDSADKIASFYTDKLKADGFKITGNINGQVNDRSGSVITAENEADRRTIMVTLGQGSGGSTVTVVFTSKR